MTVVVQIPGLTDRAPVHRPTWRRHWPLPVSVLLHAAIGAVCLFGWSAPPPPPPLPQIELLPPAPVPPLPEEAAPSPPDAVLKPLPAFPKITRLPPAPQILQPLATTSDKAERSLPKPPRKPSPPKPEAPKTEPVVQETSKALVDAAALPVSGAESAANALYGDPSPSTRIAGPPPDYLGLLRARLEKVKRYPAAARIAGQEGTVQLSFVLDKTGKLLSWSIVHGSGVDSLDDEVGDMIARASFPPFPPSTNEDSLHLTVPVEFSLKRPTP